MRQDAVHLLAHSPEPGEQNQLSLALLTAASVK
jgi:hypothetical protein